MRGGGEIDEGGGVPGSADDGDVLEAVKRSKIVVSRNMQIARHTGDGR